jgi:hypothetical protein
MALNFLGEQVGAAAFTGFKSSCFVQKGLALRLQTLYKEKKWLVTELLP